MQTVTIVRCTFAFLRTNTWATSGPILLFAEQFGYHKGRSCLFLSHWCATKEESLHLGREGFSLVLW